MQKLLNENQSLKVKEYWNMDAHKYWNQDPI